MVITGIVISSELKVLKVLVMITGIHVRCGCSDCSINLGFKMSPPLFIPLQDASEAP